MKNINQEDLEKLKNNCQKVYFDENGNFVVETDNAIVNDSNIDTSIKGLFVINSEDVAKLISLKFNKTIKTIESNKSNFISGFITTNSDTISYILNDENITKIFEEKDEEINKLKNNIMHLKQENKYGCGLYAIANALQYKQIITEERIELSKEGNNIGQLNKWLIEDNLDVWVSVLKYDFENIIEIFDLKPKFDKFEQSESISFVPFMIVIRSTNYKNHALGCRYMKNGNIIVHDSLLDSEIIFQDFDTFRNFYPEVVSYEYFCNFEGKVISVKG